MGYFRKAHTKVVREQRIDESMKFSRIWVIPKEATKHVDARFKKAKEQK